MPHEYAHEPVTPYGDFKLLFEGALAFPWNELAAQFVPDTLNSSIVNTKSWRSPVIQCRLNDFPSCVWCERRERSQLSWLFHKATLKHLPCPPQDKCHVWKISSSRWARNQPHRPLISLSPLHSFSLSLSSHSHLFIHLLPTPQTGHAGPGRLDLANHFSILIKSTQGLAADRRLLRGRCLAV